MKLSLLSSFVIIGLLSIAPQVNAAILIDDNFNRPDGSLVPTAPTPGPGGAWTNFSGNAGDLLISGGQAVVQHGVPSEDAGSSFADVTSGVLTANFDITVNDDTPIGGGDYEYFSMFTDGGTSTFYSRLGVEPGQAGGDYTFGISTNSGTSETLFPTDFAYGQTVNGTLTYDFGSGLSSFSIGGATILSTTSAFPAVLRTFALRQSDSSNNETVFIDNLVVSTGTAIPEPGSFAVLSLIGLAGLARRRRK